jgi:hypothetical protein
LARLSSIVTGPLSSETAQPGPSEGSSPCGAGENMRAPKGGEHIVRAKRANIAEGEHQVRARSLENNKVRVPSLREQKSSSEARTAISHGRSGGAGRATRTSCCPLSVGTGSVSEGPHCALDQHRANRPSRSDLEDGQAHPHAFTPPAALGLLAPPYTWGPVLTSPDARLGPDELH